MSIPTQSKEQRLRQLIQQAGPEAIQFARESGLVATKCREVLNTLITVDQDTIRLKGDVELLCDKTDPVLIQGQSGTGKETIALALHSSRTGPFVAVNVTSLPDYLLESELFGHKKGSFTGADQDKMGMFEYANNGTIFLDEIGDMPLGLQAKLLRVLQQRTIRRVGGNIEKPITCRVIAATHQNLQERITQHKFRLDLYWRLCTYTLRIKGLHRRVCDIREIIDSRFPNHTLTEETLEMIQSDFLSGDETISGNVRELDCLVKRALLEQERRMVI